jgi:uncharacterized protein YbaP (TraB family)
LLLGALLGHAQAGCPPAARAPTPVEAAALQREAADHGLLWRITRDGHSSYLYGTLHVGRWAWLAPGPALREAVKTTDTLALELDLSDPGTLQQMGTAIAALPPLRLPVALQQRLQQALTADCLQDKPGPTAQPAVMQALTLALSAGRRDGLFAEYGSEVLLLALARGRPVHALETVAQQMAVLLPGTEAESLELIDSLLSQLEHDQLRPALRRIAAAWDAGRLDELAHYEDWCDCLRSEIERRQWQRLTDDRQPQLADGIDALHRAGRRVLAAVGALHMVGPLGLPQLLAQRGYVVERVTALP